MTNRKLFVLLLAILSFSSAAGKHFNFEQYFSKYIHKSSSITPSPYPTPEITTSESIISSKQDDIVSEELPTITGDKENPFVANDTILHSNGLNDDPAQYMFIARVATIVGSLVFVVLILACIVCCCPKCCRGPERRGFIIGNRREEVIPYPVISPAPQQPTIVQHIPPDYTPDPVQQFPPQYQQPVLPPTQYAPLQQGYQYSPVETQPPYAPVQSQNHYSPVHPGYQNASQLQFYNPPEAPPPYEPPAKMYAPTFPK